MRTVAAMLIGSTSSIAGAQAVVVGPNVQVSAALPERAHAEVSVSADPVDPNRLLACSMVSHRRFNEAPHVADGIVAYLSIDGGRTWRLTLDTLPPQKEILVAPNRAANHFGDPSCELGFGKIAYTAFLSSMPPSFRAEVLVSKDGGASWRATQTLNRIGDRAWLTVDRTGGKFNGRVYLAGQEGLRIIPAAPDSFGKPIRDSLPWGLKEPPDTMFTVFDDHSDAVVMRDGTYVELIWRQLFRRGDDNPLFRHVVISSTDGGLTFLPRLTVGTSKPCLGANSGDAARIAADTGSTPFRDRLYVVWSDYSMKRCRIMLAYSSDRGKSWSRPIEVDDVNAVNAAQRPDNFMPTIAVNAKGVVGIMWYDRRESSDNRTYVPRFSYSIDGGETFEPSVVLLDHAGRASGKRVLLSNGQYSFDHRRQALGFSSWQFVAGNYAGLAADFSGRFHPVWVDARTGIRQVWTSTVTVNRSAIRNGSAALADWRDMSDSLRIDIVNIWYDSDSRTVTADAYVGNPTNHAVGPNVRLQALSLRSDLGIPAVLNADNGTNGAGATWNLSELFGGSPLPPNSQTTRAKRLEFRLSDVKALVPPSEMQPPQYPRFIEFRTRILVAPAGK